MPRSRPNARIALDQRFQHAQHRPAAAMRLDLDGPRVVEHDGADAIAGADDVPREQRRELGRRHRLHLHARAEEHRQPLVDDQQHAPLALVGVDAGVRLAACAR